MHDTQERERYMRTKGDRASQNAYQCQEHDKCVEFQYKIHKLNLNIIKAWHVMHDA